MSRDMIVNPLEFGTPAWAGDFSSRDHLVPGPFKLNPARFFNETVAVSANGAVLLGATSITVDALAAAVPAETALYFAGSKYARTSAAAAAGATTLAVYAVPAAIADNDVATVAASPIIRVEGGILVSRTIAERDAETGYGPFRDTDPASETFLTFYETGSYRDWDAEMYRPLAQVYENFLPGFAALSATAKAMIRSRYLATIGTV